jgi:hypothetical protein
MGGPVQDYRRIPPGLRTSTTRNDKNISDIPYLAISSIKPQFWPAGPKTHKRGEMKKYERANTHPRERGKKRRKNLEI